MLRILPSRMHAVPQDGGTTPGRVFYYVTQLEAMETMRIHQRLPMEPAAAASSEQYWGLREAHIVQKRLKRRRCCSLQSGMDGLVRIASRVAHVTKHR